MAGKNDDDLFCGNDEAVNLDDEYYNDYIISIDDVDFELERGEDDDEED